MSIKDRGFASMTMRRLRQIGREGGRLAHLLKRGHEWTREEATEAGRKGRLVQAAKRIAARSPQP